MIGTIAFEVQCRTPRCKRINWYETIENWDDYTDLCVSDYEILAWQSLPPAYEED